MKTSSSPILKYIPRRMPPPPLCKTKSDHDFFHNPVKGQAIRQDIKQCTVDGVEVVCIAID